jgi:endonuclease-3
MPLTSNKRRRVQLDPTKGPQASDFLQTWSVIEQLRSVKDAPVDLWGCDKVVDHSAPRDVFEFQVLVAAMLSSQTKDQIVSAAMTNLRCSDLSLFGVLSQSEEELDEKIKMVGFHRTKSKNIRLAAALIQERHGGRVPQSYDDLVKLPGVGPKMANLVMSCAFNVSTGICVDTHVHRITNYLGWGCKRCKSRCSNPEHTREALEKWVPKELWRDFTYLLVGLGQQSQSQRQLLLDRCMRLRDPDAGLLFLRRIRFNFNGLSSEPPELESSGDG